MITKILAYFRVRRGARLLDCTVDGWWWKVSPATLDVLHPSLCPLGQIYAGIRGTYPFLFGRCDLGIHRHPAIRYGFDGPDHDAEAYNARWREEIRKRRRK